MSTNNFHKDKTMAIANAIGSKFAFAIFIACVLISCQPADHNPAAAAQVSHDAGQTDPGAPQSSAVKDGVGQMAAAIARDVSSDGPVAWLRYFADTTAFFMASDGQLVFPDHSSSVKFINEVLVKQIRHIHLKWNNLRIDSLTPVMALMGSDFHEDLTYSTGKTVLTEGYFTGIAQQGPKGWQLRNAHWSIKHTGK